MEIALAGNENMANFNYGENNDDLQAEVQKDEMMEVIEIALRDTCVKAYRRAYDKVSEEWEKGVGRRDKEWSSNIP